MVDKTEETSTRYQIIELVTMVDDVEALKKIRNQLIKIIDQEQDLKGK